MLSDTVELEILKQLGASTEAKKEEDGDTLLGQSIAATLRTLDPQKKAFAKMRLQQVLYEIQFNPTFPTCSTPPTGPLSAAERMYQPFPSYTTVQPTMQFPNSPEL